MRVIDFFFILLLCYTSFCCLKSIKVFKVWLNHYILTNVYWLFCLFLSIYFNDYQRPVSNEVYYIFFTGLVFFNLTLFTSKIPPIPKNINQIVISLEKRRSLELIVLLTIVPIAYYNFKLMQSGVELWEINHDYWHENRSTGFYLRDAFIQNVVSPTVYVLMSTCFYANFNKKGRWHVLITILIGTLFAVLDVLVTGGGRTILMKIALVYFLSYFAHKMLKDVNIVAKINVAVVAVFVIVAVAGIGWASSGRGHDASTISLLSNRLILFPALFESYYINTDICQGYTLGTSMFETPIAFLSYPFKFFGFEGFERISGIEQRKVFVPALYAYTNADVSAYLYYMRDFGYLGIFLGPYLVGVIYNYLWKICRTDSFLLVFYFVGIGMTCIDSSYPFRRGFVFILLFVFICNKYMRTHDNKAKNLYPFSNYIKRKK